MAGFAFRAAPIAAVSIILIQHDAAAQWSSNPALNLAVADRTGDQVQPKVLATADGGCYVSWFDNSTGGYDVYLQRLNRQGAEMWPHNGVLVADLGLSSTTDYGLAIDAAGNALLAFQDDRTGGTKITVSKVSPAGALLWGSAGVHVTQNTGFSPKVAAASDGFIVAGWTEGSGFRIQRLDAGGAIQWAAGGIGFTAATGSYAFSDLRASDSGNVIALWVRPTGGINSPRHLYTQKFSPAGDGLWNAGSPVIVYDGGSVQNGYFPPFVSDNAGGAVYGWYENSGVRNGYVQRVDAAGNEVFAHNGVACSTNTTGRARISASVAFCAATNEIFSYWADTSLPTQNMWSVYGQKFDGTTGARQWTDNGKELVAFGANQPSFVTGLADLAGNSMAFWFDQAGGGARVMGARLDGAGNLQWGGSPILVCSTPSGKARLAAWMSACGEALVAWSDSRNQLATQADIYAQNVRADGTFGVRRAGDVNSDGSVNVNDLLGVINAWGPCPPRNACPADVAPNIGCNPGDGIVNVNDLLMVINNWG